jgi:hypothetical protein
MNRIWISREIGNYEEFLRSGTQAYRARKPEKEMWWCKTMSGFVRYL